MNFKTYSNEEIKNMYLSYVNDFLTVEKFQEHYNIESKNEALLIIRLGQLLDSNLLVKKHLQKGLEYLLTHNKNYTKAQYFLIDELNETIKNDLEV